MRLEGNQPSPQGEHRDAHIVSGEHFAEPMRGLFLAPDCIE
jgi:hypothetical protein